MSDNVSPAPRRLLGIRVQAMIETVVILAILLALDAVFGRGDRYLDLQPHPFWIPVLLIAAQYGLEDGLFAAVAASAALLAFNIPPPPPGTDFFGQMAGLALNPALWTMGALLVGGLAERHLRRIADATQREKLLDVEAGILREYAERLAGANEALENRIAGQLSTFASLYDAAKAVERETPGEVLMGAARLVRSALNAREFSIYLLNNGILEAALCEGWSENPQGEDRPRAREFRAGTPLFDRVIAARHIVHVAVPAGEAVLNRDGLMAGPVADPVSGTVRGMLKIERLAFEDFTPAAVHNFKVLCDWLGAALSRAEDLQNARATSLMAEDGTLLSRRLLSRIEDLLARLAQRTHFPLAALDIDIVSATDAGRGVVPKLITAAVAQTLRGTDLAFESADGEGCCVLLPAAGEQEARSAAARFQAAFESRISKADIEADVRIVIRVIASGKAETPPSAGAAA